MKYSLPYLLLTAVSLLCGSMGQSQALSYLGIEQGLSNNSVRCIFQDRQGFMWFGTYDGLSRFDGSQFRNFRNRLYDSSSLPHNYIYALAQDHQDRLWVGTGQGVGIYDPHHDRFSPAYFKGAGGNIRKIQFNVTGFLPDAAGNMFIASNGYGLLVQPAGAATATQVAPILIEGKPGTSYYIPALCRLGKDIWVFVNRVGLCRYNYTSGRLEPQSQAIRAATSLAAGTRGEIWVGTRSGVYRYHPTNRVMELVCSDAQGLSSNKVSSLAFAPNGHLWIGTEGGGVSVFDPASHSYRYLLPGTGKDALSSESVFSLLQDQEGRTWLGTLKGGINIVDPHKNRFQTLVHNPLEPGGLPNDFVSAFYEDASGKLWVGTDGGGFGIWDRATGRFRNYQHQPGNNRSLSHNFVTAFLQDGSGRYWVSTFGGGINRFDPASGVFTRYHCVHPASGEINGQVWRLLLDQNKNLWASTFGNGKLYRYHPQADSFEVFSQDLGEIVSLTEDRSGRMWAGNINQLVLVDRKHGRHKYYDIGKPVRYLFEDRQGRFWLGTEGGGLVLFDRDKGRVAGRYSDRDGLCNNSVLCITQDGSGKLWLSTFNGLSQFDVAAGSFRNHYQSDGLQSNQFIFNAGMALRSGELVFGGIKGFSIFWPDSIRSRTSFPALQLTSLQVNGRPPEASLFATKKGAGMQQLELPYNQALLSVGFAALEYTAPRKIRYSYMLEGWDRTWTDPADQRVLHYSNLREGAYRLRIRSTNASGRWNPQELVLQVTVLPPWYRSWWAYLLYVALPLLLLYRYQLYRKTKARLEYDIQLAQLRADQERELNERKLSFFTSVSHEFRTPLTLILNPVKELVTQNDGLTEESSRELKGVYQNARRLLGLVDQLLLFRKAEAGSAQLHLSRVDMPALCLEVFQAFVHKARSQGIDFRYTGQGNVLEIAADREQLEIILYNLLSNALKFTPDGGRVTLGLALHADSVVLTVADSGIGIAPGIGDKLFERFYQAKDAAQGQKAGFGIGLYLVKKAVERHGGTVSYTAAPGMGTTFSVCLPLRPEMLEGLPPAGALPSGGVILDELAGADPSASALATPAPAALEAIITEQKTLLVADDNEEIRQYVARIFKKDYRVLEAADGSIALELVRSHTPDLVITDLAMPQLDGISLCRAIKEDAALAHIPVILLTGSSGPDTHLKGVEGGADDFLTKPFEKELLVARVSNLLKNRSQLQQYFYNEITLQQNAQVVSEAYKAFLDQCIATVEKYIDDENFNIGVLASELGMSHSNLYKKVKSISGQSVNAFIRFIRLRKAAELMIHSTKNVNETALAVGFNDIKYFREQFARLFGMNPSAYIRKYRKAFGKVYKVSKV